jgi:hypothetical protein
MVLVTQQSGLADEDFAIWSWQLGLCFFFLEKNSQFFRKKLGKFWFFSVISTNLANF